MKQVLALSLLCALARSACLSDTTLKSLGFASTQQVEIVAAPTVCTDVFKAYGACVPEADVKAKMQTDSDNLSASLSGLDTVFSGILQVDLAAMEAANTSTDEVNLFKTSFETYKTQCINAYSTLQQGVTCYLASGDASNNTTSDTAINVNINTATAGALLADCSVIINLTCMLTAGVSVDSDTSLEALSASFNTDNAAAFGSACTALQGANGCTTSTCMQTQYDAYINTFFKPYDYTMFPSKSTASTFNSLMKKTLSELKKLLKSVGSISTTSSTATSTDAAANTSSTSTATTGTTTASRQGSSDRRLASSSDSSSAVNTKSSATGTDAAAHGTNSGVTKVQSSGSFIVSALVSLVVALIAY